MALTLTADERDELERRIRSRKIRAEDARRARLDERAEELIALGATKLYEKEERGAYWVTIQDPEGNEFCLD